MHILYQQLIHIEYSFDFFILFILFYLNRMNMLLIGINEENLFQILLDQMVCMNIFFIFFFLINLLVNRYSCNNR
jgi:hypothetical protein